MTTVRRPRKAPLTLSQARILALLEPRDPKSHPANWPHLTRAKLVKRIGYSPRSGLISRVLNGGVAGSTNDLRTVGMLELGLLEAVRIEMDGGIIETAYRATAAGVRAYLAFVEYRGKKKLPARRDAAGCTNKGGSQDVD